jgi:hypothetical protein
MTIVEYNNTHSIIVEFQDKYRARVHTSYHHFKDGAVKNPYCPNLYNVGMVGDKYQTSANGIHTKEYQIWTNIIVRCYSEKYKNKRPTYKDATCCNEWLLYENFYEWLHSQENFENWYEGERWAIDKDILIKGNKIYSPETCCLVPNNINSLFVKRNARRGKYPIGVAYKKRDNIFTAHIEINGNTHYIGSFDSSEQAFLSYKKRKEDYIKQVAQEEYDKGNITKQCYDAMMKYEVEITD